MAGNLSDAAEKLLLDWLMTTGSATRPSAWFVGLHKSAPNDAGGGTEVTGGSYARTAVSFAAATSGAGSTANSAAVSFPTPTADWGTVTHMAIYTAATGGTMLWHAPLDVAQPVLNGNPVSFEPGDIQLSLD